MRDILRLRIGLPELSTSISAACWGWSTLLLVPGAALLYYGHRYSEWTVSVPNLLGMLFLWYGVVLLLQRAANRMAKP